jgi:serralysin
MSTLTQRSYTLNFSALCLSVATGSRVQRSTTTVDDTDSIRRQKYTTTSALLAGGNRWWHTPGGSGEDPLTTALRTINYSFMASPAEPDAIGFVAMNTEQMQSVRAALSLISTYVNLSFNEVGSGGQLSFGTNNQNGVSAGYAFYPNEGPGGTSSVMLARDTPTFNQSWGSGTYTWRTLVHEVGHALGLKHPGNYNAGGGGTEGPYLSRRQDTSLYSIMSYNNDTANFRRIGYNGSAFQTSYVNPDSMQLYDIAALQYLYGAANSIATTYVFGDADIFARTIFNNNPDSRIDLSAMTRDNRVDLRGGSFSSIGLRDAYADMGPFLTKSLMLP